MDASDRYDSLLQYYGEKEGIDWRLLKAQIKVESDFNPDATSPVGAKGLAQFMDRTWKEWKDGTAGVQDSPPGNLVLVDPYDPEDCIHAQAAYMKWLIKSCNGNIRHALAAYNWGIGNLRKLLSSLPLTTTLWEMDLPHETSLYVNKVYGEYQSLRGVFQ